MTALRGSAICKHCSYDRKSVLKSQCLSVYMHMYFYFVQVRFLLTPKAASNDIDHFYFVIGIN